MTCPQRAISLCKNAPAAAGERCPDGKTDTSSPTQILTSAGSDILQALVQRIDNRIRRSLGREHRLPIDHIKFWSKRGRKAVGGWKLRQLFAIDEHHRRESH